LAAGLRLSAATYPPPVEAGWIARDFPFASGETLPELRLHYTTLGSLAANNAVLILHGTGGSGRGFLSDDFAGRLFGPGQLLDAARYYIILPDAIGHGNSSKPSDGLRARFPRYTYDDMVRAHHRLLTEGLAVKHLRLVMGTSMGGMHTWMWGSTFPDFMDALMPLASAPAPIAGGNRIWRRMIIYSIRSDPEWNGGDYRRQPPGLSAALRILFLVTATPRQLRQRAPTRDQADRLLAAWLQDRLARADANDLLYAFESSRDYDPSPSLERIRAPLVAVNSADDLVNPPELALVERQIRRVKRGRFVLLPATDLTRGHGTHSRPEVWKQHLVELLRESAGDAH